MTRLTTAAKRRLARVDRRHALYRSAPVRRMGFPLFYYDASVRIGGAGHLHPAIAEQTGLQPSRAHLAGDMVSKRSGRTYKEDIWILQSPLPDSASLDAHVAWLLTALSPHAHYLATVIEQAAWADLCLGCRSEVSYPLITAGPTATTLVSMLKLRLAFNFTCY